MRDQKKTLSVVPARFETPEFHEGHAYLCDTAVEAGEAFCIVLGTHGGVAGDQYPLDIPTRTVMLQNLYPEAIILNIKDVDDKSMWSRLLDQKLLDHFSGQYDVDSIYLYGSRDSFAKDYNGRLKTVHVEPIKDISATQVRALLCAEPIDSVDFRRGCIWNATKRFPIMFASTDVMVYRVRWNRIEVLLGERDIEAPLKRFIGGIVDPKDLCYEDGGHRELEEESGKYHIGKFRYVCSMKIDSAYYKGTRDGLMTTFYAAPLYGGTPEAGDDIDNVYWIPLKDLMANIVPSHVGLVKKALEFFRYRDTFLGRISLMIYHWCKYNL